MRQCSKCKDWKPETDFHYRNKEKGTLQNYCKPCARAATNAYGKTEKGASRRREYEKTDERKKSNREWQDKYRHTEHGKEVYKKINSSEKAKERWKRGRQTEKSIIRHRKEQDVYRKNNPEKQRAHQTILRAVKKGDMPHPSTLSCVSCGKQARHYHHNKGYAKENWLDVVPLCPTCHVRIHLREKP